MKIIYTNHASERLSQRKISKSEIKAAIRLGIKTDATNGTRIATLIDKNNTLIVIYTIQNSTTIEIITAYRK